MTNETPARTMTVVSGSMTRRHLLAATSRLGLLAALGSFWSLAACAATEAQDEPWLDGSLWSDGTGWRA